MELQKRIELTSIMQDKNAIPKLTSDKMKQECYS